MPAGVYKGGDGRSWSSEPYRFGYQGQFAEKDDETGWNAFELRMYDSRVGRWLSTDPAGQFASPYLGMGNNPVFIIDPDGGFCYDSQGNQIACPDEVADKFEGPTINGAIILEELIYEEMVNNSSKPENNGSKPEDKSSNLELGLGLGLSVGQNVLFSKDFNTWMGKDFKIRLQDWGGNGITGGKYKFAEKTSNYLKWAGRAVALYNAAKIENQRSSGKISSYTAAAEQTSNIVSTVAPGIYGIAWTVGWEGGRSMAQTEPYLDFKFWLQKVVLKWNVTREQMCTSCPNAGPSKAGWKF